MSDDEIARLKLQNEITLELAAARATEEGVRLFTNPALLPSRVVNGVVLQDDCKTPMAGSAPDGSATIADLVAETRQRYPMMFQGDGRGGGGARQTEQSVRNVHMISRADFERLSPDEKHKIAMSGRPQIVG